MRFSILRKRAFTLVEMMIVVAILGLIVALAIPNFLKSRTQARKQVCIENLSQIESAKQLWGLEMNKREGETPVDSDMIGDDKYIKKSPNCPAGGTYTFNAIGANATCNIAGHELAAE
ncbi:MAG TPA: prepilin-type N-terminal cleavage/methylation domain-containing protein [Methylomirabilota bacterium]|nr:prepilin-type N-terminal cleavage/methylation domain-containing protein [Methylomirabilota bacterium]